MTQTRNKPMTKACNTRFENLLKKLSQLKAEDFEDFTFECTYVRPLIQSFLRYSAVRQLVCHYMDAIVQKTVERLAKKAIQNWLNNPNNKREISRSIHVSITEMMQRHFTIRIEEKQGGDQ